MAKSDWFGKKPYKLTSREIYQIKSDIYVIESKKNEKRTIEMGPRKIILEAYEKSGKKGAIVALRILNKKLGKEVYSWNQVENWIKENERLSFKAEKEEKGIGD